MADDPRLPTLRIRLPAPLLVAIAATAKQTGQTTSAAARELLIVGLTSRGQWPPKEGGE